MIRHIDFKRHKFGLFKSELNPTEKHIQYMLKKFRSSQVPEIINLGDLVELCQQRQEFPIDLDEAFGLHMKVRHLMRI